MSLGKGIQTKRQNFVRKQLQLLKSERRRHSPKGGCAARVLLTLHSLILCLIFFRESLTLSLQVLQTEAQSNSAEPLSGFSFRSRLYKVPLTLCQDGSGGAFLTVLK